LGSQLVGTLYVLDEPSIGLHPRDTMRLVELCRELARAGNTVVVVEHDREFIAAADHVVELGPGSGERGGEIVFAGSQAEFQKATRSLTARYVTGREVIPLPPFRRAGRRHLVLVGAREHNLKDVTVRIPLHTLTVVSGVSGSGKSTLVHDTLYRAVARAFKTEFTPPGAYDGLTGLEYLKGVRLIDQAPIGRTPRSNPVTYVKAFDEIRKLYAALPRARALGLGASACSRTSASATCVWASPPRPSRGGRRSGSRSPPSSARARRARCSTSWTSPRRGSTSTTSRSSSACSIASWTPVTRSSSSSTISTSSSPRTTSSTSVPRAATRAERSSPRGRRRWWPRRPARTPASSSRRCSQSSTARTVAFDRACLLRLDRRRRRVPCPLRRLRRPVLVRRLLRRAP